MLHFDLRSRVRELWNRFRTGGITNPQSAIEQISYLMFLKRLEDIDNSESACAKLRELSFTSRFDGYEDCRWSFIRKQNPERMLSLVRDRAFLFLKELRTNGNSFSAAMRNAVFTIPKASLLAEAIEI